MLVPTPDQYDEIENNDEIVCHILSELDKKNFSITGNKDRWEKGWRENLEAANLDGDIEKLTPKFIRPNQPLRLFNKFIRPKDPLLELNWYKKFRDRFFYDWISPFDHALEFGCGSGFNLIRLREILPTMKLYGVDWARSSIDILNQFKIKGGLFDFFNPDPSFVFPEKSVMFTIGAIEQTGQNWQPMMDFILEKKPARVCHIEPIYEWYGDSLVEYTAKRAHRERNFCIGWWPKLLELEQLGKIRILYIQRTGFGSLIIEGYSQIVWEPI